MKNNLRIVIILRTYSVWAAYFIVVTLVIAIQPLWHKNIWFILRIKRAKVEGRGLHKLANSSSSMRTLCSSPLHCANDDLRRIVMCLCVLVAVSV